MREKTCLKESMSLIDSILGINGLVIDRVERGKYIHICAESVRSLTTRKSVASSACECTKVRMHRLQSLCFAKQQRNGLAGAQHF